MHTKSNRRTLSANQSTYLNLPVVAHRGLLDQDYLNSIANVLDKAIHEYTRVCAIRIDLRLPSFTECNKHKLISRFTDSLNEQIKSDLKKKRRNGGREQSCTLRFVWAKERCTSLNSHYHVLLLLNKDVYHCLGSYKAESGNMASRIKKGWASATGLTIDEAAPLVNFPDNPIYYTDSGTDAFHNQFANLFYRASYLAKVSTKEYGDHNKSFGCSKR